MSESVNLPALGESVTEGTVTRWLKQVGDRVEIDEPLLEVSTDKVDTQIPSPGAGVIEAIHVQEDETVEVGAPLVTIGTGTAAGQEAGAGQEPGATSIAATPVAEAKSRPRPNHRPAGRGSADCRADFCGTHRGCADCRTYCERVSCRTDCKHAGCHRASCHRRNAGGSNTVH